LDRKKKIIRSGNLRFYKNLLKFKKYNFYGAKILGAGAGGFWYLLGKKEEFNNLTKKFKSIISLKIDISKQGSKVICRN
jgi:galactokinase/mevalonate kinase-like predicted kinase